jgi:diacylglycerol kinase
MMKFLKGFSYAFNGLKYAFSSQINMKFHILATLFVIAAGLFFKIENWEWIAIVLCISLVMALELVNTAIEKLTDLSTKEIHPLAKIVKDCAAAAVLIAAIGAAVAGCIIFIPHIANILF